MKLLKIGFGLFIGLFLLVLILSLLQPGQASGLESAQGFYQLDKQRQDDAATATSRKTATDLWNILPPVLLIGVITTGLLILYQNQAEKRRRYVPDENGFYPVPNFVAVKDELGEAVATHVVAALMAGSMAALVERHTAPPIMLPSERSAPALPAPTPVPAIEAAAQLPTAPSWRELMAQGFMPTRDRMLLGYSQTGPIYGGIDALLSTAIAGRPGQGKSTLLRAIYAQTVMAGGQIAILDPHGSLTGDVGDAGALFTASDAGELDDAGDWLQSELERRLAAYKQGARDFTPLLVLCDEWPVIALKSEKAVEAAGRVILEMRKVAGYALISGQGLPAGQFGGSLVRDALSSRYVFKTAPAQARMAGLDKDSAKMVDGLDIGRAVFAGPIDPQILAIPQTTVLDLASLTRSGAVSPGEKQLERGETPFSPLETEEAIFTTEKNTPEIEGVIARLREMGMGKVKILEAVYGVKPGKSQSYQNASQEYDRLIAGSAA